MRRPTLIAVMLIAAAHVPTGAVQASLDLPAVNEALLFARTATDTERQQFNRPYRVVVGKAPVDYVEVITPYRRIVLEGSARRLAGNVLGQSQALDMLQTAGATIDVSLELTLNPLNTYIGVPNYRVALDAPDGRRIAPTDTFRTARWIPRLEGPPSATPGATPPRPPGGTMVGATIVGRFALSSLNANGNYEVEVGVEGGTAVRAAIALAGMR
jgi:hypothetical protein